MQFNIFDEINKQLFNKPIFGTNPKLLARRDSPDTSREAAAKVDTTTLENMVYEAIKAFGEVGCISDDIVKQYAHMPYSSITARFSGLERKSLIKYTGEKRKGRSGKQQRVMVSI